MLHFIASWALSALALLLAARLFRGFRLQGDFADALWVAAGFSILSFLTSWFIFGFLGVATLGLGFVFRLVNEIVTAALVLKLTSMMSSRLKIDGFVPALGTAVMLALASQLGSRILP